MVVHDFNERLACSHSYSDAVWWREVYELAFPTLAHMTDVRADGWAQRAGIDRILTMTDGGVVKVDEKVREKDYGDIILERWSDKARRVPGWVQKSLDCDYIAYAVAPSQVCYLLPRAMLQRAWRLHGRDWINLAERQQLGYRVCDAENRGYITQSIAVPTQTVLAAIADALVVTWCDVTQEAA